MDEKVLDPCNPGTLQAICRRIGLVTSKERSQNFLIDRSVVGAVVDALMLSGAEDVFEIGPGIGTLTAELSKGARRVIAVDIDEKCLRGARIILHGRTNVTLVHGDALRYEPSDLGLSHEWIAAGNLPYAATGALLTHLFERDDPPARGVFLLQREVAARLSAEAGEWSLATVAMRSLARVERLVDVPPTSFSPAPSVYSSVVRLTPDQVFTAEDRVRVLRLARVTFQMRRKTLRHGIANALAGDQRNADEVLERAGVDSTRRPGTLTLDEWRALARAVTEVVGDE